MAKNQNTILKYGSLHNAAARLYAQRNWYRIKRNGDIEMLVKFSISSKIKVRLVQ